MLTGGEIFLRKDIFDILELASKLHFEISIYSNASLLTEKKIIKLSKLNVMEFSLTIFSMDSNIHDAIVNRKDALRSVLKNVSLMKKYGIRVVIKTPVMKDNFCDYEKVYLFCKENDFTHVIDPKIKRKTNGEDVSKDLRITKNQLDEIVNSKRIEISSQIQKNQNFNEDDLICRPVLYSICITSKGDVVPCIAWQYKVGSILEKSILEIWKHSEKLKLIQNTKKSELTECLACRFNKNCTRCPGDSILENGNITGCTESAYFVAEAVNRSFN